MSSSSYDDQLDPQLIALIQKQVADSDIDQVYLMAAQELCSNLHMPQVETVRGASEMIHDLAKRIAENYAEWKETRNANT